MHACIIQFSRKRIDNPTALNFTFLLCESSIGQNIPMIVLAFTHFNGPLCPKRMLSKQKFRTSTKARFSVNAITTLGRIERERERERRTEREDSPLLSRASHVQHVFKVQNAKFEFVRGA